MPQDKFDSGEGGWITLRETAELSGTSVRTVRRRLKDKKGPKIRTRFMQRGRQRIMLLNREDVERFFLTTRLEHPTESEVIDALMRGEPAASILRSLHLSLDDFVRIRDRFALVTGGHTIQGPEVREMCEALETAELDAARVVKVLRAFREIRRLLDIGKVDDATVVAAIRTLLERHSKLVGERRRTSDIHGIVKPLDDDEPTGDWAPPSSKQGLPGAR
jgi:hypothetical protein